jgi:hypothetical protein
MDTMSLLSPRLTAGNQRNAYAVFLLRMDGISLQVRGVLPRLHAQCTNAYWLFNRTHATALRGTGQ